jgi:excinuclease UvrABC nuclease subunit
MEQYRRLIEWSAQTLIDPAPMIREQTRRMQQAAADLQFESAGKIKQFADQLGQLGKGAFRHARRLEEFAYLTLQHGPREGTAKIFLITAGRIEHVLSLIADPTRPAEVLRQALTLAAERQADPLDEIGAERIGVVAHHLFLARQSHGVFLPMTTIDEKQIAKAWRDLRKQKTADEVDGEGLMKELEDLAVPTMGTP